MSLRSGNYARGLHNKCSYHRNIQKYNLRSRGKHTTVCNSVGHRDMTGSIDIYQFLSEYVEGYSVFPSLDERPPVHIRLYLVKQVV